jgi:hypothetical protein
VINWGDEASRGKAEWTERPDEVGEAAREHRPDEVGKSPRRDSFWPANGGEFEAIMFGGGVFLKGKNFHSIVIVVPLHVSKFYRALKKLTAYLRAFHVPDHFREVRSAYSSPRSWAA